MLKNCKIPLYWLLLSFIIVVVDQVSKMIAVNQLSYGSLTVFPFFNFTLMYNSGMAFSLFDHGLAGINVVFIVIGLVVCGVILVLLKLQKHLHPLYCAALALIMGGALGNVIDRIHFGFVVDFLDFHLGNYHWPAFNIADSAICLGAVLLMLEVLMDKRKVSRR